MYSPEELKASLDAFIVPDGFTRLHKGKCDTSGIIFEETILYSIKRFSNLGLWCEIEAI